MYHIQLATSLTFLSSFPECSVLLYDVLFSFTADDTSHGRRNKLDYGTMLIDLLRNDSSTLRDGRLLWLLMMLLPTINLIKTSGQPNVDTKTTGEPVRYG